MSAVTTPIESFLSLSKARVKAIAAAADTSRWLTFWMVLAVALLGGAVAINDGRLHWRGLQWLCAALMVLAGGLILCRGKIARLCSASMIYHVATLVVAAQIVLLGIGGTTTIGEQGIPRVSLLACLLTVAVGLIAALATRFKTLGCGLLIGGFGVAAWAVVWTSPHMLIDVLEFQRESASAVLHGTNPYHARYRNIYHPSTEFYGDGVATKDGWLTYSFPYPPLSVLLVTPGYVAGDVRFAHAGAVCLAAILLIAAGRNTASILAAGMLLTSPRLLHVIQMGWTEPILILLAALLLFALVRARRALWIAIGLFFAAKQYLVVGLPLLALVRARKHSMRRHLGIVILGGLLAAAITVPFVLADVQAFVKSTIQWQLVQPFRYDALSFPAMAGQLGSSPASGLEGFVAAGIAILIAFWKAPRNAGGFFASAALVFCCFFALNKQAFCNYYQLVIGLCCCAIVGLFASEDVDCHTNPA